ncbi:hypothetical protein ACJJTC_007615 [Scirpophaga incertulas]
MSLSLILIVLAVTVYYYLRRHRNFWKKRGVVGPECQLIWGNFKDVVLQRQSVNVRCKELHQQYPNEKVVGLFRLLKPILLVRDLDIIQHIMIRDFDVFANRGFASGTDGLMQNLFMLKEDKWRTLRARLSPIFTSGKLKNMFHLLNSRADNFVHYLNTIAEKEVDIDVYPLVQKYTISTISACAFGIDIDLMNFDDKTYSQVDKQIFNNSYLSEIEFVIPKLENYITFGVFPPQIGKFFTSIVDKVFKARGGKPSNRRDFMDLLLEMKNAGELQAIKKEESDKQASLQITDEIIAAQAFVFYAGGYETSATTVGFLLHELAMHQDVQDRLIKEIDETLKNNNGKIDFDVLKEMTYLTQVFDETLRMYPIVDPLRRTNKNTYTVPGTNLTLPKDSLFMVSVAGIHYDEKYYPDPYKFDPDRFFAGKSKDKASLRVSAFRVGSSELYRDAFRHGAVQGVLGEVVAKVPRAALAGNSQRLCV